MRLSEYKGKQLLKRYGIPIPMGFVAKDTNDVEATMEKLNNKAVIKAMVPAGGRGKAGYVKVASDISEAVNAANKILGKVHKGHIIRELIIESAIEIKDEYYLSVILDDVSHSPVLIFSVDGGVDIEEVAEKKPDHIFKVPINPNDGSISMDITEIAILQGIPISIARKVNKICCILCKLFVENDLVLGEINPLVVDGNGQVVAADCKMELDDSAIFRHKEYSNDAETELGEMEKKVKELGSTLVSLGEGDVGIICNGAGMGMAMIDMLNKTGIKPVNFLDSGGGLTRKKAKNICQVMFEMKDLKALIINLWGSITLLDDVALGIIDALEINRPNYPIVTRLLGNRMEEAMDMLEANGIKVARVVATEDAIKILADTITEGGKN